MKEPVYGIWDGIEKRFVFGVREKTEKQAFLEFKRLTPKGVHNRWKYRVRIIPNGWINPPNPRKKLVNVGVRMENKRGGDPRD